jgi:hypothetical protein
MSTSIDGSVNGKCEARKRIFVDLEERLAEFLQHPLEVSHVGGLVDDEALDLMEHRRVRLVAV